MKLFCRLYLWGLILTALAACAAPVSMFKDESNIVLERIRVSSMEALFPLETADFYRTIVTGNSELAKGEINTADLYYRLAIGKAEILEALYAKELKKREEAAKIEAELKLKAEAELERQRKVESDRVAELAREEAARAKRAEADKADARKRAEKQERAKQEKEVQLVPRHTVKRGETLPQIASMPEVYGDSSLWPLIYRANRDQISNPAVLWPGQVLRIPRNSDKGDFNEARRFAAERGLR